MPLKGRDQPPSLTLVIPASLQLTSVPIPKQKRENDEAEGYAKEAFAPISTDVLTSLHNAIEYQRHEFTADSLYVLRELYEAESASNNLSTNENLQGTLSTEQSLRRLLGLFDGRADRVTSHDRMAMCKLYYEVSKRVERLNPTEFSGDRKVYQAEKSRKWKEDRHKRHAAEEKALAVIQLEQEEVSLQSKSILSSVRDTFPVQNRRVNDRGDLL